MDNWQILLPTLVLGYLLGSFSFARLVFAIRRPGEAPPPLRTPSKDGQAALVSHAVGATNVMIAFGPRWGMFVTALDILKGFLPTLALRLLLPEDHYHLVVGVAVLVGHLWPVWHRFVGGGGNSSIIGMVLAISPLGVLVTHAIGMLVGRFFPMVAFLGGIALTIPWFMVRNGPLSPEALFAVVITILYLLPQLPAAFEIARMKRAGHPLDIRHIMNTMKRSAATGKPGAEAMADPAADGTESPAGNGTEPREGSDP